MFYGSQANKRKQEKKMLNAIIIGPMLNLCSGRIKSRIKIPCKMIIMFLYKD